MKKNFRERCYALLRKIPAGKVTTYKELAHGLGTRAYRAVGQAMNKNPYPHTDVPCHRVVQADGSLGGFMHAPSLKIARLKKDGIKVRKNRIVDFEKRLYKF